MVGGIFSNKRILLCFVMSFAWVPKPTRSRSCARNFRGPAPHIHLSPRILSHAGGPGWGWRVPRLTCVKYQVCLWHWSCTPPGQKICAPLLYLSFFFPGCCLLSLSATLLPDRGHSGYTVGAAWWQGFLREKESLDGDAESWESPA